MNKTKSELYDCHILMSKANLMYLDEYIENHQEIKGYSDAIRNILTDADIGDKKVASKLSAIGKEVSIILEILKTNAPEIYEAAKKKVEDRIQYRTTRKANKTVPKTLKDDPYKVDIPNFLGK